MSSTDFSIASCAPPCDRVKTVSRMMSGGSAGFRMMIALPRSAPPSLTIAFEVVSVNSSMLARVPGPADFEPDHALGRALDRVAHRDGRLPAAGDHIDVRLVDVRVAVDDRNGEGADPRRGEVDHLLAVLLQDRVVVQMSFGRG